MKKKKIYYKVIDPFFSKKINIKDKIKKKFCKFDQLKERFDIILITLGHDYIKKLGIRKIKSKLSINGKIFDIKSVFNKNDTNFRL